MAGGILGEAVAMGVAVEEVYIFLNSKLAIVMAGMNKMFLGRSPKTRDSGRTSSC